MILQSKAKTRSLTLILLEKRAPIRIGESSVKDDDDTNLFFTSENGYAPSDEPNLPIFWGSALLFSNFVFPKICWKHKNVLFLD